MALHAQICDHIKTAHSAVQEWNNADDERKQEMESKLGEQVKDFLEEFFEGATSSIVVASTALAAGVSILAFWSFFENHTDKVSFITSFITGQQSEKYNGIFLIYGKHI